MAEFVLSPFGNAFAGAVGGVVSNSLVYPLDTVKTRIQASERPATPPAKAISPPELKRANAPARLPPPKPKKDSVRTIVARIIKEQGFTGFYRGFWASMLNTFSMQFAYFYWYTFVRRTYIQRLATALPGTSNTPPSKLSTVTELILGAIAGALAQIFTIPVSVVATRQQLSSDSTEKSLLTTARDVVLEDGITGLWRGLKPSLVLTVNPAITYGVFERLKSGLPVGTKMSPGRAFVLGATSKTLATVVTYPYIMAKVRLQAKYEGDEEGEAREETQGSLGLKEREQGTPRSAPVFDERGRALESPTATLGKGKALKEVREKKKERYNGAIDVLSKVYKEKGLTGWYQGMSAQITKAVLAQALLFGIKDALEESTLNSLIAFNKAARVQIGVSKI